jgi:hypothetical protein
MKILKTLTFGVMTRGSQNPVLARRAKPIHRLEQQKRLAQDANIVAWSRSGCATTREAKTSFNCKSEYVLGGARTHSEQSG